MNKIFTTIRSLLTFSFLFLLNLSTKAQTSLSAGDIAIVGISCDTPDDFAFVPLINLEAGTTIKFTDNGVLDDGTLRSGESTITFTAPAEGIPSGTIITQVNNTNLFSSTFGGLSANGDQVIAYQEGANNSITYIFAAQTNSTEWQSGTDADNTNCSALPPGLTNGTTAVAAGSGSGKLSEYDNTWYSGTITNGTKNELLAAIGNNANWSGSNTNYGPVVSSFTVGSDKAEPSSHATNFSSLDITNSSAELNWSDATGDVVPDGYLIKGAISNNSITPPVDGTQESNGNLVFNINSNVHSYSLSGLLPSTEYTFQIFSYTNSGSSIDYKVSPEVPSVSFTTLEEPTSINIIISRMCDPKTNYAADRFAEIYNAGNSPINITNWKLENIQNGIKKFEWEFSDIINPGQTIVCGRADNTGQTISPDVTATWSGSSWNGSENDGTILKNSDGDIIDYAVCNATSSFSDKQMVRKMSVVSPSVTLNENEWNFSKVDNALATVPGFRGTVWNGTLSSVNWTTESNWNNGLPNENIDVTIYSESASMPTVNNTSSCKNITIQNNGWVKQLSKLTIHGTAKIERYITTKKWHYITSPLQDANTNDFTGCYLYKINESSFGDWQSLSANTSLESMKGYCVMAGTWDNNNNTWTANTDSILLTFEGILKSGDQTFNLSFTPQSNISEQGWNLLANPYMAPLNIVDFVASNSAGINNAVYVYNSSNYQSVVNGVASHSDFDGVIAPMQGFFVQAKTNGQTATMNHNFEVTANPVFKSDEIISLVRVKLENQEYSDETVIRFKDGTSQQFDANYDAWKLFPTNSKFPMIYSKGDTDQKLSINTIPVDWNTTSLPIELDIKEAGEHTISAHIDNIPPETNIYLIHNEETTNIKESAYTFNATPGLHHFTLKTGSLITSNNTVKNTLNVIVANRQISVNTVYPGQITLYSAGGRQILTTPISREELLIPVNQAGIFILNYRSANEMITQKICIQ